MAMISIGAAIHLLAEEKPEAKAITCEGHSITRRELDLRTNRLARAYAELGVVQDAFVTIALPNGIEFYEACVATWKLGATPQPVSAKLPAIERTAIIELAKPALVVGVDGLEGTPSVPAGFTPSAALSDEPLPDRTAASHPAASAPGRKRRSQSRNKATAMAALLNWNVPSRLISSARKS